MQFRRRIIGDLTWLAATAFIFIACYSRANNVEVNWTSGGFSTSQVTINTGDEVDVLNYDDTFDLQLTGASPESFYFDVPPTDGINVYYGYHVYNNPGTFTFSDEFADTVTVTVTAPTPLSMTITDPTNNTTFSAPATFDVTAVPTGGSTPYFDVEFFVGTNYTGDATSSPFTATVTNLSQGTYTISAIVTDNSFNTATNSITVNVGPTILTNYILPAACADIYSSGNVNTGGYLDASPNPHGGLEFAAFNAGPYTVLLELNPYALPLYGTNVSVYGFDGGNGTLYGTNFNSGTLIGVWTLPAGLGYGQIATYDVSAFVKSCKGPYFGFILVSSGDVFSSTSYNYGTPPELFVIGPPQPPSLTATRAGNQMIISWPTNNAAGLALEWATNLQSGATWTSVIPSPVLTGSQWTVTNPISGPRMFFRLSNH